MTKKPEEPDWNNIIDAALEFMSEEDRDERPVGLQCYHLSEHSRNINSLDVFQWPDEWIKAEGNSTLLMWLEHEFEHWWEDQAFEDEGWRGWLEGFQIRVRDDAYITELNNKLMALYRERITETYPCSICGKLLSEKHPYSHPDHIVRIGLAVDSTVPRDEIVYVKHIFCDDCNEERIKK